jgi:heparan-alpha-glucosaminide N-acetyltransferase
MTIRSMLKVDDPAASQPVAASRIESIDIFRGLTVVVMIFVDNLGFVRGLPWWTYHMPAEANGMTYVDMVFPAFLFLMGMSIPLSVRARITRGEGKWQVWAHVVVRALTLVALGLFVANAPNVDPQHTHLSAASWTTLGFIGIALLLIRLPGSGRRPAAHAVQRGCGLVLLIALVVVFRRTTSNGRVAWLDFSDWEILGLLGWAYLLVSTIYLLFAKKIAVLASALPVLVAVNALSTAGYLAWLKSLPTYLTPFEAGLSSITMAGLLASLIIADGRIARMLKQKIVWVLVATAVLFAAGWVLRPLGISKIRDTPTWCLYCIAANLILILLLYWLVDVKNSIGWTDLLQIIGANALLAYFLPYTAYLLPRLGWLTADGTSGAVGVARSLAFTGLVMVIVLALNQAKIRLRL